MTPTDIARILERSLGTAEAIEQARKLGDAAIREGRPRDAKAYSQAEEMLTTKNGGQRCN